MMRVAAAVTGEPGTGVSGRGMSGWRADNCGRV